MRRTGVPAHRPPVRLPHALLRRLGMVALAREFVLAALLLSLNRLPRQLLLPFYGLLRRAPLLLDGVVEARTLMEELARD